MEIYGGPVESPRTHRAHHPHWVMAALLALAVLLASGIGWTWISSGGFTRPSSRTSLSAPTLPDFKLPPAPRPQG